MTASQTREGLNRATYASYLLEGMQEGRGRELINAHSWIDTKGLKTKQALGKIAREVLVDYGAVSKSFRRWGRGFMFPFGTWYFHNSALIHRWMKNNYGKAAVAMMGPPLVAAAWNNRSEDMQKMETEHSDFIRNKVHFNIARNPDGTNRVWLLQLPQDVLIGTKVFSIATDYGSRVVRGEMTPRDAALKTIKEWGLQEYRGIAYLSTPLVRFFKGWADRRDPYDKTSVFSTDYNKLNEGQKVKELAMFFVKTAVPFLSSSIKTYQRKQPMDVGLQDILNSWVGKEALGIFDMTPKGNIKMADGTELTMDDVARMTWLGNKVLHQFDSIERGYVAFRGSNEEYIQSKDFTKTLTETYDMFSEIDPKVFDPKLPDDRKAGAIAGLLSDRLVNVLIDPGTQQNRFQVRMDRAKTDEEKAAIQKDFETSREMRLFTSFRKQPTIERSLLLKKKMEGSEFPWHLILTMP